VEAEAAGGIGAVPHSVDNKNRLRYVLRIIIRVFIVISFLLKKEKGPAPIHRWKAGPLLFVNAPFTLKMKGDS
jgi:hypothetical protein